MASITALAPSRIASSRAALSLPVMSVRAPSDQRLAEVLRARESLDVTSPHFVALHSIPRGYHRITRSATLGSTDEAYERAAASVMNWELQRGAGLRVVATDTPAAIGTSVALAVRMGVGWAIGPCRVVAVVDQPHSCGYTYSTLPGHVEVGEESFLVTRRSDGSVTLKIEAVSAPANVAVRAIGPFGSWMQGRITDAYVRSVVHAVRG